MLPKSGDSSQPTNWRPIAALKITYKIFSRSLYNRLRAVMDEQQPNDQTGFRPNTGIDDAFVVLACPFFEIFGMECSDMVCKARLDEGVLIASSTALFFVRCPTLLLHFVVGNLFCKGQTGSVHGSERFNIERGERQGDVISPNLFNAGLEHARRKWKAKLVHHGVQLGHGSRLTNIRYADDLMLFATFSNDLIYMLEIWFRKRVVCNWTRRKQKILTTSPSESSEFVDVCEEMVRVIHAETVHKYLGRNLGGNFLGQEKFLNLPIRLQVAWKNKFHKYIKYKHILLNKHVSLVLRLKNIWPSGVSCHALRTCNLAIDKGLLAKTWCRAKTNASGL